MADTEDSGLLRDRSRTTLSPREAAEQRWGSMVGGRYRVEELLSFDEMGALYRARDTERGAPCALRILPEIYARDADVRDRFLRDAEAAQVLRHENIVEVLETGKLEDGGVFSVMELLDGQTLKQVLEEEGRISAGRAVHIASQCCRALGTAHEMGIVHRDLKPSNIMLVTHEGELDFVKLHDFGICSHVDGETSALTALDKMVGSPDYMAPEQAAGEDAAPMTDIYALGTVLFEMLTGQLPYSGRNAFDLLMKKGAQEAPRVDALIREVPAPLADLVAMCLAPKPENRVQSMRVLEVELLRSLDKNAPRPTKLTGAQQAVPLDLAARTAADASMSSGQRPVEATMSSSNPAMAATSMTAARPTPIETRVVIQQQPVVVETVDGRDTSNAWLWLVAAGTLAVVLVLFGPQMFGGTEQPPPAPTKTEEPKEDETKALDSVTKLEPVDIKKLAEPTPIENAADALVVAGRAEVALQEGRFCEPPGESLRDYLAALKQLDPTNEAIERLSKKMPDSAMASGKKLLGERRFYDAGQVYRCVLALAPDTKGAKEALAEAIVGEGKLVRAMKQWDELVPLVQEYDKLGLKPSFDALMLKGQAMGGTGRWQEALDAYGAAVKAKPADKDAKKALDDAKKQLKAAAGGK